MSCLRIKDYRGLTKLSPDQAQQLQQQLPFSTATAQLNSGYSIPLVGLGTWCVGLFDSLPCPPLAHAHNVLYVCTYAGRRARVRSVKQCLQLCAVATGTLIVHQSMATSTRYGMICLEATGFC